MRVFWLAVVGLVALAGCDDGRPAPTEIEPRFGHTNPNNPHNFDRNGDGIICVGQGSITDNISFICPLETRPADLHHAGPGVPLGGQ